MSLEQTISDLTTQAGLLLDLPQTIADAANQQVNAMGNAYQNHLNTGTLTVYLDGLNGSDTGTGLAAQPLKTIHEAVERIPYGGIGTILLVRDYHIAGKNSPGFPVYCANKTVTIGTADGIKHKLTFERATYDLAGILRRRLSGFGCTSGTHIGFRGIEIVVPEADGGFTGALPTSISTIVQPIGNQENYTLNSVAIFSCTITLSATPFDVLIFHGGALALYVNTVVDGDQTIDGSWVKGVAASTSVTSLPDVMSNLSTL